VSEVESPFRPAYPNAAEMTARLDLVSAALYIVVEGLNQGKSMSIHIHIDKQKIEEFCRHWRITEFAFFGSALRDDFRPDSDVDVLVTFAPDAGVSLFDMAHMQNELSQLLGRDVDLVSRRGIERSPNYLRRKSILSSLEVVYAA
jgi:uncharacterized protein